MGYNTLGNRRNGKVRQPKNPAAQAAKMVAYWEYMIQCAERNIANAPNATMVSVHESLLRQYREQLETVRERANPEQAAEPIDVVPTCVRCGALLDGVDAGCEECAPHGVRNEVLMGMAI